MTIEYIKEEEVKRTYRAVYKHEDLGKPEVKLPKKPYITKDIEVPKGESPEEVEKIAKEMIPRGYKFQNVFPT